MVSSLGTVLPDRPTPPEYVTKRQIAADHLREMIVAGDLLPGSQVRQQEIAALLGISATPVREAIWQLVSEGYLQSLAHVGFRVTQPQVEWFPEVLDLRLDLESRLARIAATVVTPDESAVLQSLDEQFCLAVEARDVRETRLVNFRLHKAVWAIAHQPITETIVSSLWAKFPRTTLDRVDERGPRSAAEHHKLVLAISAGDPAHAEATMRHHITAAHGHWGDRSATPPIDQPAFDATTFFKNRQRKDEFR